MKKLPGFIAVLAGVASVFFDGLSELVSALAVQVDALVGTLLVIGGLLNAFWEEIKSVFNR